MLAIQSCNCDCPTPSEESISQYKLDKVVVEINTTNVSTGLETVFAHTIFDSASRAHLCQIFVDDARFFTDESGYFFIETLDSAWVVAHINHDLIGTKRINISDENGKFFIKEMVETVNFIGHGFVEYYRRNPVTDVVERKMSFVTSIPSANWFIGTGFYGGPSSMFYSIIESNNIILKEVTTTVAKGISGVFSDIYSTDEDRIAFCRDFIDHIRFFDDGEGYFFINDFNGINIAHGADTSHQGHDDYNLQDSHGAYIIRDMIEIAETEGSGYYDYFWVNPVSGKEEKKITHVVRIPDTDYFIGAGYYLN